MPESRRSSALASSSLACLAEVPTINFTAGCAHGCLYCYTRGYSTCPGEGKVIFYQNTLVKLQAELQRKKKVPGKIYFSSASDPFQPLSEVHDLAFRTFQYLLENKVAIAFLSKGRIPNNCLELFKAYAPLVHASIGLSTTDAAILETFEPRAADPETRLRQIRSLIEMGIDPQVRVDPILPGVTDHEEALDRLCSALRQAGVKKIAVSCLFLRLAIIHFLKQKLKPSPMLDALFSRFQGSGILHLRDNRSTMVALGINERREIYTGLKRIAERHKLAVKICGCKNQDLTSESCNLSGAWNHVPERPSQTKLFIDQEGG